MNNASIKPSLLGSFFSNVTGISFDDNTVSIAQKNGKRKELILDHIIDFPILKTKFWGTTLLFKTVSGNTELKLLNNKDCKSQISTLQSFVTSRLEKSISSAQKVLTQLAFEEFPRDSSIEVLNKSVFSIIACYLKSKDSWQEKLSNESLQWLDQNSVYFPLESGIEQFRSEYEERQLKARSEFYDRIESNPLTHEQRLSVIRDNDRNLVLAAAGTGKTSVMVAKALDLIDQKRAKPEQLLVLAYNNGAAKELRQRLKLRSESVNIPQEKAPTISTFHALGRSILKAANISTSISKFMDDETLLEMWVSQWLVNYVQSSMKSLKNFIDLAHQPVNPFDFKTKEEYEAYIRDNEYRTLQGERVKGYQELLIANWLFMNCIDYEYEAPYVSKRRIEIGFDYRPDFHLTGTNIYIEHFGIDREGKTRADIDANKYNNEMTNKISLHQECETILLKTYHYDWVENKLEDRLKALINNENIETRQRPSDEIFETLRELGFLEDASKRYLKCLQAIRVERLDDSKIIDRLKTNKIANPDKYTEILSQIHEDYVKELRRQNSIDFDDMIIRATNVISEKKYTPKWTHILVDEFQDISAARMDFLKSIINAGDHPRLTAVGDDWQSIYRFSGGKLELTTRFEELVGSCSITKLQKTFRYNNSIADTAGNFVMQNPEQYKKSVVTHTQVDTPQVILLDSCIDNESNIERRTAQVIETIRKNDPAGSIAVLARYKYLIKEAKAQIGTSDKNIDFWTFHGSKGLEADYCILIGFFQGKAGFPNQNTEEAVVEALLPSLDTYPHSEERRLLYVAITRAKRKCYVIADPMAPSEFINELLTPRYEIRIGSKTFEEDFRKIFKCSMCSEGYYKLQTGTYGEFYSCTSGVACPSKPRICSKCGSPSIDSKTKSVCNNHYCNNQLKICDKCGRPMKLREGKFGKFWGCSGFGIEEDQCKNTINI